MSSRIRRALQRHIPQDLTTILDAVNAAGPQLAKLPDEQFPLEPNLVTRLAVAREAAQRSLGERPHDTQVLGAAALASGRVFEMLTGEGKTLAAALAVYAMAEGAVHVATANDYLAARDAEWMEPLYRLLGLTVGVTTPDSDSEAKLAAYRCDVTYGTAREFAFDYLRDTLTPHPEDRVQTGHNVALIDEIDFILLDEARIPFVITRPVPVDAEGLAEAAELIANLDPESDFRYDDVQRTVWLTEDGIDRVEAVIGVGAMDDETSLAAANVQTGLRARCSVQRDRDYIVVDGRVAIVDESTGRVFPGRRWAGGLHQAVEAREGVAIREDTRPLAQITVRSYLSRYRRVLGMSGTAMPSYREFKDVYGLDVLAVPPHRPVIRADAVDQVFKSGEDKYAAAVDEIIARHSKGQPVLVGTATVAHSEYLSSLLDERDIEHRVLNAKHHAEEAAIIAEAGRIGAVTVATNMAGRGVDIKLGGSDEGEHAAVVRLGGLCVIGTERFESSRIDNQLRGRAGRQGDPGESVFFVSVDDDLVVNHGPRSLAGALASPRRAVAVAQGNAEAHNRDRRNASHEYDEIVDAHYAEVCRFRSEVVDGPGFAEWTFERVDDRVRYEEQAHLAGDAWEMVQRRVMYDVLERGWSTVLETMYGLRNWVNLVVFGGNYPITEWRRRSDVAIERMEERTEHGYLTRLLGAEIVRGRPVVDSAPIEATVLAPQPQRISHPELPKAARYESPYRDPLIPDWAEGFAGPQFQEVVQMVDPAGAQSRDGVWVVTTGKGTTVYVNGSAG